jgi:hypothetical protein
MLFIEKHKPMNKKTFVNGITLRSENNSLINSP